MSQTSSLSRHFRAQARPRSCITSPSSGIAAYLRPHPQHLSFPTASLTTLLSRNFPPLRNGLFSAVIWAGWVRFCHQSASWTDCIRLVIRFVQPRFQPAKPKTHSLGSAVTARIFRLKSQRQPWRDFGVGRTEQGELRDVAVECFHIGRGVVAVVLVPPLVRAETHRHRAAMVIPSGVSETDSARNHSRKYHYLT